MSSMRAMTVVAFVALAPSARASELSLNEVLVAVDRAFPANLAAQADYDTARADQLTAAGGFDTSWKTKGSWTALGYYQDQMRVDSVIERPTSLWGSSFFVGWRYGSGKFPSYYQNYQSLDAGDFRVGTNVPMLRNGFTDRRRVALFRAELGTEVALLSVAQQRLEARRAASLRYWAWLASAKRVGVARDVLALAEVRDVALEQRVRAGEIAQVERTENARGIAQRRAQLVAAERALQQSTIELGLYLRDAEGAVLRPDISRAPADFPVVESKLVSANSLVREAEARRPEPARLALQRRQFAAEVSLTKNQLLPVLDLQAVLSQDVGHPIEGRPDLSKPVLELGIVLEIPLENRALRGRRDAALAGALKLEAQERLARDRVRAEVDDALSAQQAAIARIAAARDEVRLASAVEQAERIRFDQGDGSMLFVNQREQLTAEARLRELEAKADAARADADLAAATALLP